MPDAWRPGAAVSDAVPALDEALSEAGWDELGADERLLPFAAPAAAALGRGPSPRWRRWTGCSAVRSEPAALARYAQ